MTITRLVDGTIIDNMPSRRPIGNIQSQALQDIMSRDIYGYNNPNNVDYRKVNQIINKATSAIEGGENIPSNIREVRISRTPKQLEVPRVIQLTKNKQVALPTLNTLGRYGQVASKYAGPVASVAVGIYDPYRSNEIADQMEQINKIKPNSYRPEEIKYYRDKARRLMKAGAIGGTVGLGVGAAMGAPAGGVGAIPGGAMGLSYGMGVGNTAGNLYNWLKEKDNPYKETKIKDSDLELLNKYLQEQRNDINKKQDDEVDNVTAQIKGVKATNNTKPKVVNGRYNNQPKPTTTVPNNNFINSDGNWEDDEFIIERVGQ